MVILSHSLARTITKGLKHYIAMILQINYLQNFQDVFRRNNTRFLISRHQFNVVLAQERCCMFLVQKACMITKHLIDEKRIIFYSRKNSLPWSPNHHSFCTKSAMLKYLHGALRIYIENATDMNWDFWRRSISCSRDRDVLSCFSEGEG